MRFDLLIKNGEVVDRGARFSGLLDVAIAGNRIVAVEPTIAPSSARSTIDATGRLVTPGLVDLHTHAYPGATFWGVDPDDVGPRTGVTTWVDAGSAGAYSLVGLIDFASRRVASRVVAFVNIAATGLIAPSFELANLNYCDPELLGTVAESHPAFVRGVKVRMGVPMALSHGVEPLKRAISAADAIGVPVMAHIGHAPPRIDEVIACLRPGDILTHAFTGLSMRVVDDHGHVLESVKRACDNGLIFDIGHGSSGFSFETASALISSGFYPDTISSDAHALSINGPMFDLPTCMTKLLDLGMPIDDVVYAASGRPAAILGMQGSVGTLAPGAFADVAIFELETGTFPLFDGHHNQRTVTRRLRSVLTIFEGKPVAARAPAPPPPWVRLTAKQANFFANPQRGLTVSDVVVERADLAPQLMPVSIDPNVAMRSAYRAYGIDWEGEGEEPGSPAAE